MTASVLFLLLVHTNDSFLCVLLQQFVFDINDLATKRPFHSRMNSLTNCVDTNTKKNL